MIDEEACLDFMSKEELAPIDRVNYCKDRIAEARRDRDKEIANFMIDIVGKFKQEPVKNDAQKVCIKLMYKMGYHIRSWLLLLGKFKDVEIEEDKECEP